MILIANAGAIVLTILAVLIAGCLIFLLIKGIIKEERRFKDEDSVLLSSMVSKNKIRESIDTYA